MAKTEGIPANNDDTLLALISSLQGLTLVLQANLGATTAAQPPIPVPPPTAPPAPSCSSSPAATTAMPPAPAPTAPPTVATTMPPVTAPTTPPVATTVAAPGTLAAVYLTPLALSSRGIHPTDLETLPDIVSAPESGSWFVVTVGRYTGVYQEWLQVSPLVTGWSGGCCKRLATKSAALAAYDHAWRQGVVQGDVHPDHEL